MRRKFLDEVVAAGMRFEGVADLVYDAVCDGRLDLHRPECGDCASRQARQHRAEREPGAADAVPTPSTIGRSRWTLYYRGRSIT